ncbi:MAG TPA: hypothetical protein VM686_12655 [Polyangiaceae bacterium]|nr:hypothetical protein [Polyangiaceae bacterium]
MRGRTFAVLLMVIAATVRCGTGFRQGGVPPEGGSGGSDMAGSSGKSGSGGKGGASSDGGSDGNASAGDAPVGGDGGAAASAPSTGAGGESGAGNSAQAGAAGSPAVDTSVHGKVMHEFGGPLPGWQVVIGEKKVITNELGEFTVPDVGETYDLLVAASDDHLRLYQGVTTREPIAVMSLMDGDPGWVVHTAGIAGSVLNTLTPTTFLEVWIHGRLEMTFPATGAPPPEPGSYANVVTWNHDENPAPAEVRGVQLKDNTTWRAGILSRSLAAGVDYSGVNVTLEDLASRTVITTPELAPGVSLTTVVQCLSEHCDSLAPLPMGSSVGDARVEVRGTHLSGTTKTFARPTDDENELTLLLTAPSGLFAPTNAATGVSPGTEFSWQPYADGIHVLKISAAGYLVEVYTSGTSFALADIAAATYGTGTHTWKVLGLGPATSVDDYVGEPAPVPLKSVEYLTESTARSFTPQ